MVCDLNDVALQQRASTEPWNEAVRYWQAMSDATAALPAPLVAVNLAALAWNANDLARRAGGVPIRIATKSIRSREILHAVLALDAFRGALAYSLSEALWLSETVDDVLVAYPTADTAALRALAANERALSHVTLMIDSVDHLEFIAHSAGLNRLASPIRICLDFDASWWAPGLGHIGVRRSPVHDPSDLRALAEAVLRRPEFTLVGIMSYEAQIAGIADAPADNPAKALMYRTVQSKSARELAERRAAAVATVRAISDLEFVNGGGTGSLERTASEPCITEVAAGSGLFGPHLFDHYRAFRPAPAVGFALDVVRRPAPEIATILGGGWIASGAAGQDRLPIPVFPEGLRLERREGAGEVQTPVFGPCAASLRIGDRVWFRHAKSGEPMEHVNEIALVDGESHVGSIPTYRGEGRVFL